VFLDTTVVLFCVFRYLLRKLLQFQAADGLNPLALLESQQPPGPAAKSAKNAGSASADQTLEAATRKPASKKKAGGGGGEAKKKIKNQAAKDLLGQVLLLT
jgi:hypothetical protein